MADVGVLEKLEHTGMMNNGVKITDKDGNLILKKDKQRESTYYTADGQYKIYKRVGDGDHRGHIPSWWTFATQAGGDWIESNTVYGRKGDVSNFIHRYMIDTEKEYQLWEQ